MLPDPRLPERDLRCYYEGRKDFLDEFQSSREEPMAITQPSLQDRYWRIVMPPTAGDGPPMMLAEQNKRAHHLNASAEEPHSCKDPFTIEMLFERHLVRA